MNLVLICLLLVFWLFFGEFAVTFETDDTGADVPSVIFDDKF